MQERHDEIAEDALRFRRVELQPVVEVEDALGARPVPYQGIEGRQQRRRRHALRDRRPGGEIGRLLPAIDRHRLDRPLLDELCDRQLGLGDRQAEIVANVDFGRDAMGARPGERQGADRVGLVRGRRRRDGRRNGALGQVVDTLEAAAMARRHLARPEQVFERRLALVPAPPGAAALARIVEFAGRERPAPADLGDHGAHIARVLGREPDEAAIDADAGGGAAHAPAHQRLHVERQQRRLMRPVFEQRPPGAAGEGALVERVAGIGADAAEHRQIVRAHQHVHRIDLQQPHARDHRRDPAPLRGTIGAAAAKALRGKRDAARLFGRKGSLEQALVNRHSATIAGGRCGNQPPRSGLNQIDLALRVGLGRGEVGEQPAALAQAHQQRRHLGRRQRLGEMEALDVFALQQAQ